METIGIDVDGTIADVVNAWLRMAREKFAVNANKSDIIKYDFWELFDIPRERWFETFKELWNNPDNIGLESERIPEILHALHSRYNISIVTATVGEQAKVRYWLQRNGIEYDNIIFMQNALEKGNADGISIYVDDYAGVASRIASSGRKVILLSQPWNAEFANNNKNPNVIVAKNWDDVERILTHTKTGVNGRPSR